ncbi:MAG: magnesium/cobalt transporter CorA [Methanomicrobium sp.]|nr:magnesium/cobalt transporter CorA [Methanomicrobium sp.]MDD4299187.1 magnesium/cobalt transporter CorA [Methanomicrobium sp.]
MAVTKKYSTKESSKAGMPPGTLIGISEKTPAETKVSCIEFDSESFNETDNFLPDNLIIPAKDNKIRWIEIKGHLDIGLIEKFGQAFGIHPLTLEDILNTYARPKYEEFENYLFVCLKNVSFKEEVVSEQISIIIIDNFVVTVNESDSFVFENIKKRIMNSRSKIRSLGSDYLMYMMVDTIVDGYYSAFEAVGDKIEDLEERIIEDNDSNVADSIYSLKKQIIFLRKNILPVRDMILAIRRSDSDIIGEKTGIYFNDLYDHIIQIIDTIETYRDMISEIRDIHLSSLSNRMNEVMKVLTIIATIFIPLTYIAGIYGMNFHYMPELEWIYGYPATIAVMIAISAGMIYYFRKRKWL